MKKLFILLLALTLLPVPMSFAASDETLDTQDLHDYLVFGEGSWWTYDTTVTDLYNETVTTTQSTVIETACTETEDCFTLTETSDTETIEVTYYLEGSTAYYSEYNGVTLAQAYVKLSLDSYSQMMPDEDYTAFGFETFDPEVTSLSCDTELDTQYSYQDETVTALVEDCTLTTAINGTRFRVLGTTTYVKGLGMVSSMAKAYLGTIELVDTEITLTDSSITLEVSPFSDVETSDTNFAAIDYLTNEEVFSGYEDGTFLPDNTVNRAELLKILVEGTGVTPDETTYQNCFIDVGSDWYAKYVCYAKEQGWVEGYLDGSFKPADPVNKVEALKMLLLSQGVELETEYRYVFDDAQEGEWFTPYVLTAQAMGLLEEDGQFFNPDADRDRKGIAENLYRLLLNLELSNAAEAMAQGACLLFDSDLTNSELEIQFDEVMTSHGYESHTDIDVYLAAIQNFSFYEDMEGEVTSVLESTCSADLESSGVTAKDLAAVMVQL